MAAAAAKTLRGASGRGHGIGAKMLKKGVLCGAVMLFMIGAMNELASNTWLYGANYEAGCASARDASGTNDTRGARNRSFVLREPSIDGHDGHDGHESAFPRMKLSPQQTVCVAQGYELICKDQPRSEVNVSAMPRFAQYLEDAEGRQWARAAETPPSDASALAQPISTNWYEPTSFVCGSSPLPPLAYSRCANVGDEIGGFLLSWFSAAPIEKRTNAKDVVIVGSVLNYEVLDYNATVEDVGSVYNVTVWGTGTKFRTDGVCFDFRAVRGPKTREAFMQYGCNVPEVYGDPALLLPFIYSPRHPIDHHIDICLIPHIFDYLSLERLAWWTSVNGTKLIASRFSHIDHHFTSKNTGKNHTVRLIDVRTPNIAEFIDNLKSCNLVASASLHGIILAEAYNVTYSWVTFGTLTEIPFKYQDFLLSVGIQPEPYPLLLTNTTTVEEIISYTMKPKIRGPSLYDPIQLLDACPFCQKDIVSRTKYMIKMNNL